MPMIDSPIADAAGSAPSRTDAGKPSRAPTTCKPIDWQQLSHELRTPLNAILGNVELLLDGSAGPLSAQARACLSEIQIASRQLLGQVQSLLVDGSEASADRPRLEQRATDRADPRDLDQRARPPTSGTAS